MHPRGPISFLSALVVAASLYAASAQAVVVYNEDNTTPDSIAGVAGFATNGALMSGMNVTATFSGGFSQTVAWGVTGPDAGAATGAGWSLSEGGDTFGSIWTFSFLADTLGQLVSLTLDGAPGLTLFDRFFDDNFGTDGSARGIDFQFSGAPDFDVTATYSRPIGIGAAPPVGDLFHQLSIGFGAGGPRAGSFSFVQDTDNDAARQIPEPGLLGLFGLALAAFGGMRSRPAA